MNAKKRRKTRSAAKAGAKVGSRSSSRERNDPRLAQVRIELRQVTAGSVTAEWHSDAPADRWKLTVLGRNGEQVRKSGAHGDVKKLKVGGLDPAQQPFRLLVRGHDRVGRLVCEGAVDDFSLGGR
jgi:hypothetical protein